MTTDFMKNRGNEKFLVSALKELTVRGQLWSMMDVYVGDDPNAPKTFVEYDLQILDESIE